MTTSRTFYFFLSNSTLLLVLLLLISSHPHQTEAKNLLCLYNQQIGIGSYLDWILEIDTASGNVIELTYVANTYTTYAETAAVDPANSVFYWPYPYTIAPRRKTDLYVVPWGSSTEARKFRHDNRTLSMEWDPKANKLFAITIDPQNAGFFINIDATNNATHTLNALPAGFNPGISIKASAYDTNRGLYFFIFFAPSGVTTGTQLGIIDTATATLHTQTLGCGNIINLEYDSTKQVLYAIQQDTNGYSISTVDVTSGQCTEFLAPQRVSVVYDCSFSTETQEMAFVETGGLYILDLPTKTYRQFALHPDVHNGIEIVRYLA